MIRRPPRSTHCISSAASDVYKRQAYRGRRIPVAGIDIKAARGSLSEDLPPAKFYPRVLMYKCKNTAYMLRTSITRESCTFLTEPYTPLFNLTPLSKSAISSAFYGYGGGT
eukprot:TRINITY_DN26384_c0_g2_i1.p1 TRINITY_DN26384_c0_g2~~TRINITY_DN26384_c0_g2_i1.p1  ORF type:complete len:120 (-),score=7.89 TRINITY_DN26384_c0_g2_i1:92-424(-)